MKSPRWMIVAPVYALALAGLWMAPASAQSSGVEKKPPMYTYVANWAIPRARWADMQKNSAADDKIMEKAVAAGNVVGYGADTSLIHSVDGSTHDTWFSGMSMASVLNTLDEIYKAGGATAPVLVSATKHWDGLYVSRYYNWRSGSWRGAYSHFASYKLKSDAPGDALETLSKNVLVPMLEKLLADGTIFEYEIDVEAVHTQDPNLFYIDYITASAEGLDKFNAALQENLKNNPLILPAFTSIVDFTPHRDELVRTDATYK